MEPIVDARKEDVDVLYFDSYADSLEQVAAAIIAHGADITDIALVQHHDLSPRYLIAQSQEPVTALDEAADASGAYPSWAPVLAFVKTLAASVGLKRFDFLACALYRHANTAGAFAWMEAESGVDLRASANMTGNPAVTGNPAEGRDSDWIMESDNVDIREAYFTGAIADFHGLLAYTVYVDLYGLPVYMTSTSTNGSYVGITPNVSGNCSLVSIRHTVEGFAGTAVTDVTSKFGSSVFETNKIRFWPTDTAGLKLYAAFGSFIIRAANGFGFQADSYEFVINAGLTYASPLLSTIFVLDGGAFSATVENPYGFTPTFTIVACGGSMGDGNSFTLVGNVLTSKAGVVFQSAVKNTYSVAVLCDPAAGSGYAPRIVPYNIEVRNVAPAAPTVTSGTMTVRDGLTWPGATFKANDSDGGVVTYALSGNHAPYFSLNTSTGVLTSSPASRTYVRSSLSAYYITITAKDSRLLTSSADFVLTVLDAAPGTTSATTLSVAEGGAYSATLSATNATSYAVTGGANMASFQVSGTTLSSKAGVVFDFDTKTSYAVTVSATNTGGSTATALTITVTNVGPSAPVFTAGSTTVQDNATWAGATFAASDPGGGTLTYILSGTDASSFSINASTGVLSASPSNKTFPYATKSSYSVTVAARDSGSITSSTTAFTLTVLPAPGALSASSTSVAEGSAYSATLSSTNTTSFAITGGADQASFQISGSTLSSKAGVVFDFDTKTSYAVTVTATGTGGSTVTPITVTVTNAAPSAPTKTTGSATVQDGATWAGATFSASDPGGGTVTYSMSGSDIASFSLNTATGVLSASPANRTFPYATQASYSVTIASRDSGNLTTSTAFTLTVLPAPGAISATTSSVLEGAAFSATLSSTNTTSYAITGGADSASFQLSGTTLSSKAGVLFDFDGQRAYTVVVTATGTGGATASTLTIAVTNAPPIAPSRLSGTDYVLEGGAWGGATFGGSTDPAGGVVRYTLGGTHASNFVFDASAGIVQAAEGVAFSAAAQGSYSLLLNALDASGLVGTTGFTLTVLTPLVALQQALAGTRSLTPAELATATDTYAKAPAAGIGAGYAQTRKLLKAATNAPVAVTVRAALTDTVKASGPTALTVPFTEVPTLLDALTTTTPALRAAVLAEGKAVSVVMPNGTATSLLPDPSSVAAVYIEADVSGQVVSLQRTSTGSVLQLTYQGATLGWWDPVKSTRYVAGSVITLDGLRYTVAGIGSIMMQALRPGPPALTGSTVVEGGFYSGTVTAADAVTFTMGGTDGGLFEVYDVSGFSAKVRSRSNAFDVDAAKASYSLALTATNDAGDTQGGFTVTVINAPPAAARITPAYLNEYTPYVGTLIAYEPGLGAVTYVVSGADAAFFDISGSRVASKASTKFVQAVKSSYTLTVTATDNRGATLGAKTVVLPVLGWGRTIPTAGFAMQASADVVVDGDGDMTLYAC